MGGAGDQEPGVVVEPVEDLDVGAVGQVPVGEVGLPALVGLCGFEASVGGPGSLPWFGHDRAGVMEDSADGGCGGRGVSALGQVPHDGDRAGVEAVVGQLQPQLDDQIAHLVAGRARVGPRSPGLRIDGVDPAGVVASQEPMKVLTGVAAIRGCCGHCELVGDDLEDGDSGFRHAQELSPMS